MANDAQQIGETEATDRTVFLSYAREDSAAARRVVTLLESAGVSVWWDSLIEGGVNYLPETQRALDEADCVVVLWSKVSVDSFWVRDEAQAGRDRNCLVPLGLDATLPPLGFRQFQTIDISAWHGAKEGEDAERIVRAVLAQCGIERDDRLVPRRSMLGRIRLHRREAIAAAGLGTAALAGWGLWRAGVFGGGLGSNSIAVFPFQNLSGRTEERFFSDGLSNELRIVLARNPLLRVAAPTSSEVIAGEGGDVIAAARKLGVANVLRGSVQRQEETVRVAAELVRVKDSLVRWADSFDRDMQDVFEVQRDIAEAVGLALAAEVAGKDEAKRSVEQQQEVGGTDIVAAYDAYLRGKAFYDLSNGEEGDRAALAQFDAAIAADPRYAAAHAWRATMLAAVANATSEQNAVRRLFADSIAAARKAIELAPDLAQGHLALGFALNNGELNPAAAREPYQRAQDLAPGDADTLRAVATFLAYDDRAASAVGMIESVLELDPLNGRAFRSAGNVAFALRDYPATIERMRRALALNPDLASANFAIGSAHYLQQQYREALAAFEAESVPIFALTGKAIAQARLGNTAAAAASLKQVEDEYGDNSLYQQAQVLAQWGRLRDALARLERAAAARDPGLLLARTDPLLDALRGEARFKRALAVVKS
ncbi:TIR domain-containing protein [Croceibacterium salegens]|nr:TIR domain-containing protein [Croceibacterium salegens]